MEITPETRAAALEQVGSRRAYVIADDRNHAAWLNVITDAERRFGSDIKLVTPRTARGPKNDFNGAVLVVDALEEGFNFNSGGMPDEIILLGATPANDKPGRVHRTGEQPADVFTTYITTSI